MTTTKLLDEAGDGINVVQIEDFYYPPFPLEALENLSDFKLRQDDVLVCAYPKSGTHWVWEMTRILQAGTTDVPLVEKDDGMIELSVPSHFVGQADPRTLNTHLPFTKMPKAIHELGCKIIYLVRNPKDVSVSYYNHHKKLEEFYEYHGEWKNYLPLFLSGQVDYGSWFDYVIGWEKAIKNNDTKLPILFLTYEDLKEDPMPGVKKIAKFLGKDYSDEFLTSVCEKCGFDQMKKIKGGLELCKEGTPIMYRKGQVGDWKNWFTVAQNEWFDQVLKSKMKNSNLQFRFE